MLAGTAPSRTTSIRILAVDDEPGVLALVRRCLHDDDRVTLDEASSGRDALERVENGPVPDLLITDLQMPEMAGDELAQRLRMREPRLRVLYLTSHGDRLFEVKPHLWTDEAYLDKPFTRDGLREAIALLVFNSTTL
jgi:CheY-like chemotaxis protein